MIRKVERSRDLRMISTKITVDSRIKYISEFSFDERVGYSASHGARPKHGKFQRLQLGLSP